MMERSIDKKVEGVGIISGRVIKMSWMGGLIR